LEFLHYFVFITPIRCSDVTTQIQAHMASLAIWCSIHYIHSY